MVLSSSNTTNSSYAKAGDNLTLTFNASELIETPLVTLAGDNLSVQDTNSGAGTSWQATYTVQDGDNGTVAFSIQYQDQARNSGAIVTSPDLNNSITMDTEDPILSLVRVYTDNQDNQSLAKVGNKVTLEFESTETISDPVITISGKSKILFGDSTNWTTDFIVQAKADSGLSPQEVDGLMLWLDASNIDGLKNSSLIDGDLVSRWKDLSGNDHDATQISFNQQPEFQSSNNGLKLDGIDDYLNIPSELMGSIKDKAIPEFTYILVTNWRGTKPDQIHGGKWAKVFMILGQTQNTTSFLLH